MREIRAALFGLGSVNSNLLNILDDREKLLSERYGLSFKIVAVGDSSGYAFNIDGFDKNFIVSHKESGRPVSDLEGYTAKYQPLDDIDLLFEATPVEPETGGEALETTREALSRGVSVVLANKGPVVHAFQELKKLAADNDCGLEFSATVCGGLPVLNIANRDMIAGNTIGFSGIFNGTCNFILDALAKGMSFEDAVTEAQKVGAAEADPSLDIDGWDTAFKLLILANTMFDKDYKLDDVKVTGIRNITTDMIKKEKEKGNKIKLVGKFENGSLTVEPTAVPVDSFLGNCDGWEMGIEIHSDIYGISYHKLYEKEPIPTAASMMRDAVNIFAEI